MSDWLEPVKREKKRNPLFNLLRILMAMIVLFSIGLLIGYFFHQGAKSHTSIPISKTTPSSIHQEQGINQDSGMKRGDYLGEPSFDLNLPYPAKKQSSYQALIPTETYDQTPTLSIPSIQAQKDVPPIPKLKEARPMDVSQNERIEDALIPIKAEPESEIKIETETIEIRDENQNIIESNQTSEDAKNKSTNQSNQSNQSKTIKSAKNNQAKKLPNNFFALQIQSLNTLEQANAEKENLETTYQFDQIKIQKIEVNGAIRYRLHLKIDPKRKVLEQLKAKYETIFPDLEESRKPRMITTGISDGEWL